MWLLYVVLFILTLVVLDRIIFSEFHRIGRSCPGPEITFPFLGSAKVFFGKEPKECFRLMNEMAKTYGNIFRVTFLRRTGVIVSGHKEMEIIMSSTSLLEKGESYQHIIPWIGYGLLTSSGDKWRSRRKMLTPAFHFKILNEFLNIFNKNGQILCEVLQREVGNGPFDIYSYIQLAALDNIYETAMGVSKNLQKNPDTRFVQAVKEICYVVNTRAFQIYLRSNILFRLSKYYKMSENALEFLHGATNSLIAQRKKELEHELNEKAEADSDSNVYEGKRRFAFLDMLLREAAKNKLTDSDIREEVDTFLFEGHDTVTSGLSFAIYQLAAHPEIQDKAYQEQLDIFGDINRPPTYNDIQEMKYLEMVIKESQRLYPSVPFIERMSREPLTLSNGLQTTAGVQFSLNIFSLHRDEEVWKNPDTFDPENFSAEAVQERHPYAYVPFSAGPRNCIGQRFAMLELKSTISKLIRQFRLLPSPKPEHALDLAAELVLISKSGFHIQLERRI